MARPARDAVLTVRVTGPGHLLGLDNGNFSSPEGYADGRRSTADGCCLALIQGTREEGEIKVAVVAETDSAPTMRAVRAIALRFPEAEEKIL